MSVVSIDVLVRLVALVRLEAVGHEAVVVPHLYGRPGLWVRADAGTLLTVVVAGQRETETELRVEA
jgi:hypothetical protein